MDRGVMGKPAFQLRVIICLNAVQNNAVVYITLSKETVIGTSSTATAAQQRRFADRCDGDRTLYTEFYCVGMCLQNGWLDTRP